MKVIFYLFLLPFIYLLLDLLVRFPLFQLYTGWQMLFYALSVITFFLLFIFVVLVLNKIRKKPVLFYSVLSFFSLYLVLSIIGSYIFYYFNGFFPNFYTYEYFRNEPLSAFILLKDTIKIQDVFFFALGFSIVFYLLNSLSQLTIKWNSKKRIFFFALVYLVLFSFLVVKIKKYDQCLIVDTNFSAAVNKHFFERETERKFKGRGLEIRKPILLKKSIGNADFNVLVIIFESMRKQNMGVYGYHRNTTPNISKLRDEFQDNFFVFNNPYTVSSTTMLAVPAILSGIAPYQEKEFFYSQPIIWDFASMRNYYSFFLTSHSLKWYRFDRYYSRENISHFWYKEKSGKPFYNDLGIDDLHTVNHLNKQLNNLKDTPFFGVVQMNSTHYPYTVPEKFSKWEGAFVDEYDNSILYQDYVLGKLIDQLKKSGKLENTVLIFTSDHGESLKDHNNVGHVDSYYAETISIPLMMYFPESLKVKMNMEILRSNLSSITSNIDIAPTIIDILQLQKNKQVKSIKSNYTGYSLFEPIPLNRHVITMNNNEIARFKVGVSIVKNNLHYIHRTNIVPNREELYNIKKDKKETKNIIQNVSKKELNRLINVLKKYPACEKYLPKQRL